MSNIKIDLTKKVSRIKPMHATNNGPVYKFASDQRITNIDAFIDAGIPYARNHDASFCDHYGGNYSVDVVNVFPNFDAAPEDPESYDFSCTDEYIRVTEFAGVRTFYRLGNRIEHEIKKHGTLPPKDFKKWAVICEHIIRHYTEGWADGFKYDMEYWEIWNEPDLDADDSPNKRTWGGTKKQFFELYDIAAKHLKSCFPHLKIGGPALAHKLDWAEDFLAQLDAPLDFFSWHIYSTDPKKVSAKAKVFRDMLDRHGFNNTESILNEWNYVKGWYDDELIYSLKTEKGLKGSAFIAGTMCECQHGTVDLLMYYDARPGGMNGMFSTDCVCDKLKGYYPFYMFNQLYRLGAEAQTVSDNDTVYTCAAVGDTEAAIMLTHFNDDDTTEPIDVTVDIYGFSSESGCEIEYFLLDAEHDLAPVGKATYFGERFVPTLKLENFSSYLIKIKKK